MVLGEDIDAEQDAIAVPLSSIIAVAELPASSLPGWRPADGDKEPPGHIPCPCGSGRKYRQCCRRTSSAAQN